MTCLILSILCTIYSYTSSNLFPFNHRCLYTNFNSSHRVKANYPITNCVTSICQSRTEKEILSIRFLGFVSSLYPRIIPSGPP